MSLFTNLRDIAEQSAADYAGVSLPQNQPRVVARAPSNLPGFVEKYKVALILAAGLGVLVLARGRMG